MEVSVHNNGSANYKIELKKPDDTSEYAIVGGDGDTAEFVLTYAPSGQYTVIVTKNSGTANPAFAIASVYD